MQIRADAARRRTCSASLRAALHRAGATSRCWRRRRATRSAPPRAPPATASARCTPSPARTSTGAACSAPPQALSLFADRQLIEIRIPSGKPGQGRLEALQRYCERRSPAATRRRSRWCSCRELDRMQQQSAWFAALDGAGVSRARRSGRAHGAAGTGSRSAWPRRASASHGRRAGQQTLAFFADRVEGNLLAAHQELQKLGAALPARRAELRADRGGGAQRRPLRRLQARRGRARRPGGARAAHARRPARPKARPRCWCTGRWPRTSAALKRVKDALGAGKPLPLALREARVWGAKERVFERALALLSDAALAHLLEAAHICDGLVKGLKQPDWPLDPWQGLQRLVLMLVEETARVGGKPVARLALTRLSLSRRAQRAISRSRARATDAWRIAARSPLACSTKRRASRRSPRCRSRPCRPACGRAAGRSGDAGDRDRDRAPRVARSAPSAIARATSALTAPCAAISAAGDAEHLALGLVRIGDEAALEPVARAGERRCRRRRSGRRCRTRPSRPAPAAARQPSARRSTGGDELAVLTRASTTRSPASVQQGRHQVVEQDAEALRPADAAGRGAA